MITFLATSLQSNLLFLVLPDMNNPKDLFLVLKDNRQNNGGKKMTEYQKEN